MLNTNIKFICNLQQQTYKHILTSNFDPKTEREILTFKFNIKFKF
jgi:hypothetical protein